MDVNVRPFNDIATFCCAVEPFLLAQEAKYNLIVGLLTEIRSRGWEGRYPGPPMMVAVEHDGRVVGVATRTPPHGLLVTEMPNEAIVPLARWVQTQLTALPFVQAPVATAKDFANAWAQVTGQKMQLRHSLGIHRLNEVRPVNTVRGAMRVANEADLDLLASWIEGFNHDIGHPAGDGEACARRYLARQSMFLWEDNGPVSIAACGGMTPRGVRISCVYTPPENRRRGYASALVAALSQQLLDSGRQFCFLYTDLANPTSNHIYRVIGYEPVAEFAEYEFV